jgi:hypothetical protein
LIFSIHYFEKHNQMKQKKNYTFFILCVVGFLFYNTGYTQISEEDVVDLSHVPQVYETKGRHDVRMEWFRNAKFGMFIHWGPCTIGDKEIGWGRDGNRPWDINRHSPRTSDPVYDNYYKQFNPVKFNADEWVKLAKEAGMKYMVLTGFTYTISRLSV